MTLEQHCHRLETAAGTLSTDLATELKWVMPGKDRPDSMFHEYTA